MMWGDRHHQARSAVRFSDNSSTLDSLASATNFLLSIGEEELMLQQTEEFRTFLASVEHLKRARERINIVQKSPPASSHSSLEERDSSLAADTVHPLISEGASGNHQLSFFQLTTASPELMVNISDFLASADLARLGSVCFQMYALCHSYAERPCPLNIRRRQLSTLFQLLRCAEQMNEDSIHDGAPHVPFPLLLPKRKILVSNCGDSDYNGVYYCTDCNCNGFVFSKLLSPRQRFPEGLLFDKNGAATSSPPGQQLRCMFSKQFSDTNIFWYLSKEVVITNSDTHNSRSVGRVFSFWANLMTTPDIAASEYPSQTSMLRIREDQQAWDVLATTNGIHPPDVELLD